MHSIRSSELPKIRINEQDHVPEIEVFDISNISRVYCLQRHCSHGGLLKWLYIIDYINGGVLPEEMICLTFENHWMKGRFTLIRSSRNMRRHAWDIEPCDAWSSIIVFPLRSTDGRVFCTWSRSLLDLTFHSSFSRCRTFIMGQVVTGEQKTPKRKSYAPFLPPPCPTLANWWHFTQYSLR